MLNLKQSLYNNIVILAFLTILTCSKLTESEPDTSTSTAKLVRWVDWQLMTICPSSFSVILVISIPSNAHPPSPILKIKNIGWVSLNSNSCEGWYTCIHNPLDPQNTLSHAISNCPYILCVIRVNIQTLTVQRTSNMHSDILGCHWPAKVEVVLYQLHFIGTLRKLFT